MIASRRAAATFILVFILAAELAGPITSAHGQLFNAPKELLLALRFTPDGKSLLSGSLRLPEEGLPRAFVKVRDLATGKERELLKDTLPRITAMAFAPDGRTLAAATLDKTVIHWDLAGGKQLAVLRGHTRHVGKLVFSADGKSLVSIGEIDQDSEQQENEVRLWDLVKRKPCGQLTRHEELVPAVAFSSDGKTLATGGLALRIWDMATVKETMVLSGKPSGVSCLAFSRDSKSVVIGGADGSVRVWDLATKKQRVVLKGHRGVVLDVAFLFEDKMALSRAEDGTVRLWYLAKGEERNLLDLGISKGLDLPDLKAGRYILGHNKNKICLLTISPDGRWLAVGRDDEAANFYDLVKLRVPPAPVPLERMTLRTGMHTLLKVAISPGGKKVAAGGGEREGPDIRGLVCIWDVATGKSLLRFITGPGAVQDLSWSPDGKRLATAGGSDNSVHLFDVATGKELAAWPGHTNSVRAVAFSPDGKLVASGSRDGTVRLWDPTTGKVRVTLGGFARIRSSLAFAPDSKRLITGGVDATLHLFDVKTGKELRTWKQIEVVDGLAFAPDGKLVAVGTRVRLPLIGGGMVVLWDLEKGKERKRWRVQPDQVASTIAFSPDGRWLVTGDSRNQVQVWETATGKRQARLLGHRDWALSVAWSADGKTIASGSIDGTVKLWDAKAVVAAPGSK
jgi:WD40 repeat protein